MHAEELLKIKQEVTLPRKDEDPGKSTLTRKEFYEQEGKIKVYPTELSYKYVIDGVEATEGKCLRSMYLSFNDVPETDPVDLKIQETFRLGYCIEEIIKDELIEAKQLVEENCEVDVKQEINGTDLLMSGRIDAVLNDGTMIEMKSYKGNDFTNGLLRGNANKAGMLMNYHIPQVAAYLGHKKLQGVENPELIIWYKDRHGLDDILLNIRMTDAGSLTCEGEEVAKFNFMSAVERMKDFELYIKEGKMPPRDYGYYKKEDAQKLLDRKLINYGVYRKITAGEKITPFACVSCRYKTLCLNMDD